jgi:hypothetical protein
MTYSQIDHFMALVFAVSIAVNFAITVAFYAKHVANRKKK